jgi:hypothetical protein
MDMRKICTILLTICFILGVLAVIIPSALNVEYDLLSVPMITGPIKETATRATADMPTWSPGDYWEFNEVYSTVETGGMGPVTYDWDNDVKYTMAGTSTYNAITCYNLTISGTFTGVGSVFTKTGTYSGFRLMRQSDLSHVYDFINEVGSGGSITYNYNHSISYSPVEDYYKFPIEPAVVPDTWTITSTKTIHTEGDAGGMPVDKVKHVNLNLAASCAGTEIKSVTAASNVECFKISNVECFKILASGGAQSDDRWYSVDFSNSIYRDFSETYNNSDTKIGYEDLIDSSFTPSNIKPSVTAYPGEPTSLLNDGVETSLLGR